MTGSLAASRGTDRQMTKAEAETATGLRRRGTTGAVAVAMSGAALNAPLSQRVGARPKPEGAGGRLALPSLPEETSLRQTGTGEAALSAPPSQRMGASPRQTGTGGSVIARSAQAPAALRAAGVAGEKTGMTGPLPMMNSAGLRAVRA